MRSMMFESLTRGLALGVLTGVLGPGAVAEEASMQVYECRQGDTVTYSGTPCGTQEQTMDLEYERPSPAAARAATQTAIRQGEQAWNQAQATVLDNQILSAAQQVSDLETQREARVAALRNQLNQGTENPNPEAWQAGVQQQIQSTVQNYNDQILAVRQRLDQLKSQRAALGPAPAP